jgi:GTP cyclohydrolase I
MMRYDCTYEGSVGKDLKNFFVSISVPITTLCPCSKAISRYGAHNQRGLVTVKLLYSGFFWIEDIIDMIEKSASSGLYSVLKREDEKFVTEHAYENPRFVEDVVRDVYLGLQNFTSEKPFRWFQVEAETFESIHNHNAYAFTEYGERPLSQR